MKSYNCPRNLLTQNRMVSVRYDFWGHQTSPAVPIWRKMESSFDLPKNQFSWHSRILSKNHVNEIAPPSGHLFIKIIWFFSIISNYKACSDNLIGQCGSRGSMLKNDARNDASFNKGANWTKIEKIVNFIYYPNKIDPFVKNGFFSENLFVDEPQYWARK